MERVHTSTRTSGAAAGFNSFLVYNSIKRNVRTPCFALLAGTLNMSLFSFFLGGGDGGGRVPKSFFAFSEDALLSSRISLVHNVTSKAITTHPVLKDKRHVESFKKASKE